VKGDTYLQRWNGQKWVKVATPTIPNGRYLSFHGVSCTSTVRCFAVGAYVPPNGRALPLTERWNGTSWTRVKAPDTGLLGEGDFLNSVSCASAANCVAAGEYALGGAGRPATFVEVWNGATWRIVPSADPPHSYSALSGVSCHTATSCIAVGRFETPTGSFKIPSKTLAERWDGTEWSIVSSPSPGPKVNSLSAVSCWAEKHCFAVGTYKASSTNHSLTERWNGTKWLIVASP
jgi:hypothetical protein